VRITLCIGYEDILRAKKNEKKDLNQVSFAEACEHGSINEKAPCSYQKEALKYQANPSNLLHITHPIGNKKGAASMLAAPFLFPGESKAQPGKYAKVIRE
jgi:hypothetical protein